jgi:hypothetical protein
MNNWTVIKEPFPHVVFDGDKKIYDYVKGNWDHYFKNGPTETTSRFIRCYYEDPIEKVVVGLWYFRDPNDDGKGGLGLHDINHGLCTEVPYEENKIVIFKNNFKAFHSVGQNIYIL